ncbi:unnamed protein product [Onchocerca ochengi]|uniref:Uncharacterized protein n=1 Tax=Onchocerca ochengi TaxID=42157 RepID=A0A182EDJ4_ONCOC|nr:unnamed protein product [Onchocerca ochengi]
MRDSVNEARKLIRKFNRGHRRAFSVPNASADRIRMAIVEGNNFSPNAQKQKTTEELKKTVTYISNGLPVLVPVSEDDDADLNVCFSIFQTFRQHMQELCENQRR